MAPSSSSHLPAPRPKPWFEGVAGRVVLRPWFDRLTLEWVCRVYFPLSRGWAAARLADGDRAALRRELAASGIADPPRAAVDRLLRALPPAQRGYRAAVADWHATFHAAVRPADQTLAAAEARRARAAQRLMAQRARVVPLHRRRRLPAVAFEVASKAEVAAAHGDRAAGRVPAFPAPARPHATASHAVDGVEGRVSWVSWPAPLSDGPLFDAGDRVSVRVVAPPGVADPPTFIHLHGIGMEPEMTVEFRDPVVELARRHGLRVLRPEGPWHGSRMRPGFWGGEPALARAPKGWLELMQAWVAEVGQMIAWARATSAGPVALGGLSLGALTAQLAAAAARDWPAELRPDALFLCMTSGDLLEVAFEGALARGLGVLQAVHAAGWEHADLAAYRGLLEPQGPPAPPPERIVLHLGRTDEVMPLAGGLRLADAWGVPAANRFLPWRGHFAAPLALHRDPAPLDRLAAILKGS